MSLALDSGQLPDVLRRIVARRRERFGVPAGELVLPAAGKEPAVPIGREANPFLAALAARRGEAIIAEVKMGSPRLGALRERVDPLRQARAYAEKGAAALSVVVEPDFFHGSYELLTACREASGLPAVAKDFVVHVDQIAMARRAGADAVLLVAALYRQAELAAYAAEARRCGLVPLVETHDLDEVGRLGDSPWELIGINNRDLRTFDVDLSRSIDLLPALPAGALRVAESGIASRPDLEHLAVAGFDAFLIGESLLLAADPEAKLAELLGRTTSVRRAGEGGPPARGSA